MIEYLVRRYTESKKPVQSRLQMRVGMTLLADRYFGVAEEALHLAAREPRETGVSRVLAIVSDKIIVGGH